MYFSGVDLFYEIPVTAVEIFSLSHILYSFFQYRFIKAKKCVMIIFLLLKIFLSDISCFVFWLAQFSKWFKYTPMWPSVSPLIFRHLPQLDRSSSEPLTSLSSGIPVSHLLDFWILFFSFLANAFILLDYIYSKLTEKGWIRKIHFLHFCLKESLFYPHSGLIVWLCIEFSWEKFP